MQTTNCKFSKRNQKKLLEFFVLQVTARSAANILGMQPNSAILFYRKIRMVISYHLALAASRNLPTVKTTLTALRIFGTRQNVSYANTTELIANPSRCS